MSADCTERTAPSASVVVCSSGESIVVRATAPRVLSRRRALANNATKTATSTPPAMARRFIAVRLRDRRADRVVEAEGRVVEPGGRWRGTIISADSPATSGRTSPSDWPLTAETQYDDSPGDGNGVGAISGARRPVAAARRSIIRR